MRQSLSDSANQVDSLEFKQLVSVIYQGYPEMKACSLF